MIVGVPKEIKDREARIALTPAGAALLTRAGHHVIVQRGAGDGSGFADSDYSAAGAELVAEAAEVYGRSRLIVKVKEPLPAEYGLLRPDQLLFTYLHLAADADLTRALLDRGITAIAYETVERPDGSLPLLTPMSEVAGRMAVQVAAHYLERTQGGCGKLLGGVPGVAPCHVVILGSGTVGANAARIALGMDARVTVIGRGLDRLRALSEWQPAPVTLVSTPATIAAALRGAEVVIGAALVSGARAPRLVTRAMLAALEPGAVIVDVAIDQGGCCETSRPTSHSAPIYLVDGIIHYCVPNMPGAAPRTSTIALTNVTLPYIVALASQGLMEAVRRDPALAAGVNVYQGWLIQPAVAAAHGLDARPLAALFEGMAAAAGSVSR